jgi:predicted dehydrogenase
LTRTRARGASTSRAPGDIFAPRIPNAEPLRIECEHFLECIRTGAVPRSDGESGLRVVRVLEALQRSLAQSAPAALKRA